MKRFIMKTGVCFLLFFLMACGSDDALRSENEVLKAEPEEFKTTHELFNLYTADVDTYETIIYMQVSIEKDLILDEKIKTLMTELSRHYFNAPIEFIGIELDGEDQIAVFNLLSELDGKYCKWGAGFFQGSTGGIITTRTLVETALQKEYQGEWVDGVLFLYDGETIEFQHVYSLSDTHWR